MFPNPASLAKGAKKEHEEVEQLGTITLEELHKYHCNNKERRLLCLFGNVFDVTSSEKGYGEDGAYKEYAGHDITLAIGLMKTQEEWLDRFVKMEQKWIDDAKGWLDYMDAKYPRCGKLDKWEEDPETWPELTPEEKEAITKCVIM
eukprot:Nitzschia sp. Nitz4//scaffold19_size178191//100858//101430//NITZ4_001983-RA/size178191-augustus-gene-0.108-mRNA-1//-1//CDS//3329540699//4715//frame0